MADFDFQSFLAGSFNAAAAALQDDPSAPVAPTQVRPDVDVQPFGIPKEFLIVGGLGVAALLVVILVAR